MSYRGKFIYEIQREDVGKVAIVRTCSGCGTRNVIYLASFIGRVLACDVGKRIHDVDGVYQIENSEQFANRLAYGG